MYSDITLEKNALSCGIIHFSLKLTKKSITLQDPLHCCCDPAPGDRRWRAVPPKRQLLRLGRPQKRKTIKFKQLARKNAAVCWRTSPRFQCPHRARWRRPQQDQVAAQMSAAHHRRHRAQPAALTVVRGPHPTSSDPHPRNRLC